MRYKPVGWIVFCLFSNAASTAEERTILKFDALPDAVCSKVSQYIDQNTIYQVEKITDIGYVKFEIKSTKTVNNKDFIDTDMTVASNGDIMKIAKEAPIFDIPFSVMNQITKRYPNLKVDEVETVQARYFHLTGKNNGQPVNLKVDDDGEIQVLSAVQNNTIQNPSLLLHNQNAFNTSLALPQGNADAPNSGLDDEMQEDDRSDDNFLWNQSQ